MSRPIHEVEALGPRASPQLDAHKTLDAPKARSAPRAPIWVRAVVRFAADGSLAEQTSNLPRCQGDRPMNHTTRSLLIVWLFAIPGFLIPNSAGAQEHGRSGRRPLKLADASLKNADFVKIDRQLPMPEPERNPARPQRPVASVDPYGFGSILNNYRASAGLPPVAYDVELSAWASQNNLAQNSYGLGHHVNPGCLQNSGWNYADASSVAVGWINSPAHRDTLLSGAITRFGIAYGPGPYWTLNAR